MNSQGNALLATILPAYGPCDHFSGVCQEMGWNPPAGHVPRGFCGALGSSDEVELVLVTAEPGDPLPGEVHTGLESAVTTSIEGLRNRVTPFHRNVRLILDLCFPGQSFEEQLRRTWRTNSVLCSAQIEGGSMPRPIEDICIQTYLRKQLALMPNALVAALGGKAQNRLRRHGIKFFPAVHPSSRISTPAKHASWRALAEELNSRRRSKQQ